MEKRKRIFGWLRGIVQGDDDLFMTDAEWRWHVWCEDRREILEEFTRAVANLGMTVDDAARAMSSMRGDDADSD